MSPQNNLRLHHVGYATATIETVAETYIQRFGYERSTPIIHDPLQTAFVQFLQLPGEPTYLEFVAPDGPASKLSARVERGSRLNHLCFTAGPLESAIAQLEQTGMKLISDPKPAIAFAGRRVCWLFGADQLPIEIVERRDDTDPCTPGLIATNPQP